MHGMPSATVEMSPKAIGVNITDDTLSVDLEDGRTISVPIGWYPAFGLWYTRRTS
jgi:hypothetical protein